MTGTPEQVSGLLHEAGETHHQVFRIVDGTAAVRRRTTRSAEQEKALRWRA